MLDCGRPTPGCSAYGFMFDVQAVRTADPDATVAVTGFQIFASDLDCNYDLYVADGTWRKKDDRHAPDSTHSCAAVAKWRRVATSTEARCMCNVQDIQDSARVTSKMLEGDGDGPICGPLRSLWVMPNQPIVLPRGTTIAAYLHCPTAWGAVCYKDYETIRGQTPLHAVAPGTCSTETNANQHIRILAGTSTQSPEPFHDVDGYICAFSGHVEYDLVTTAPSKAHQACGVSQTLSARQVGANNHAAENKRSESQRSSLDHTLTRKKYAVGATEIEAESRTCQDCQWHDGVWLFDCGAHIMYTS